MSPSHRAPWATLFAACLLAACGGGGGGGGESPPGNPPVITPGGGGTVTSTDGRSRLAVPPGSANVQADTASLTKATPEPAIANDPSYVLDTAYQWQGPDLAFSTDATWEVQAPGTVQALAARSARPVRSGATTYFNLVNPSEVCNPAYAQLGNDPPSTVTVTGNSCPAGCTKVGTQTAITNSGGTFTQSVCAPTLGGALVTPPAPCPALRVDASNEEPYQSIVNELNAELGTNYRICKPVSINASPFATQGPLSATSRRYPCALVRGTLRCNLGTLVRGVIATYSDTTPPANVDIGGPPFALWPDYLYDFGNRWEVYMQPGQTRVVPISLSVFAPAEPIGLSQVELREVVVSPSGPGGTFTSVVRWSAAPAGSSLPAGTRSYSRHAGGPDGEAIDISYASTDLATRRFFVRAYDWVGNWKDSGTMKLVRMAPPAPVISAFTAAPTLIAPPSGSTTLAWNVTGAASASIDQGVGVITLPSGTVTVNVSANTTFTLTARSALGVITTLPLAVTIGADTGAPTVSLAASATAVTAPASVTLSATATDAVGVTRVDFYRGSTLIASDSTPADGFQHAVAFTPSDAGSLSFTARAFDAAGNNATSAAVTVTVGTDTQPPTVTLASSASTVLAPGSITLTANATDNIGVTRVDFYRGGMLVGSDSTAGDGHTQAVSFTTADVGTHSFTARAFDAMNNQATSAAVVVTVTLPASGDTYASPGGSDTSSTCSQAAPCRTINKAAVTAAAAGPGRTTWLLDGSYTTATQGFGGAALPAGTTLRAANAGVPVVKVPLQAAGAATIGGLRFGSGGGVTASSGTIALEGIDFVETLNFPLVLSGSAAVTMTPGPVADYIASATEASAGLGVGGLADLSGSASLTVNGGAFGLGTRGLGYAAGSIGEPALRVQGGAALVLSSVTMKTHTQGAIVSGNGTVQLLNSQLTRAGVPMSTVHGLLFSGSGGTATLSGSTISGFAYGSNSAALAVSGQASITATGSTLQLSSIGLWVSGSATLTLGSSQVQDNLFGGVLCQGSCTLAMNGGTVRRNGGYSSSTGWSYTGGLHFAGGSTHSVSLRNTSVIDNRNTVVDGNTNQANNAGISMVGNAASVFDLGTAPSPGGNTFTGNTTGSQTSGIHVNTASGVTVNAVGNTFIANTQSANSTGQYQLGSAPCGASSCLVTSGAGSNYRVTSGALRLAQ